jgi:cobaltochelatase CobT
MGATGNDLGGIVALFVLSGLIAFALFFRHGRATPVADGPPDEPYRIYTGAFDVELHAAEVIDALPDASLDRARGHVERDPAIWAGLAARTDALVNADGRHVAAFLPGLRDAAAGLDPDEVVVALLIDQSGSMKGAPIVHAAAAADLFTRLLAGLGIRSEVLGFSTAGWRGGYPYQDWKRNGQPKRPGRLCALMHVIYKSAEEPALTPAARKAIVHPDLLRENVDGEALLWAQRRLALLPARHKLLLMLSDGAPVDDATLQHNGPSTLRRHLIKVVHEALAGGLTLGAVGISHRIVTFYPISETIIELAQLPDATVRVLERMLAAAAGEIRTRPSGTMA